MGEEKKEPACLGAFGVEGVPNLRYINIRRGCNFGKSFRPERGLKIFEHRGIAEVTGVSRVE